MSESVSWTDLANICDLKSLQRVILFAVEIGEVGARAIAENLTNLHTLYLGNNNLGEAGARAIA